MDELSLHEYNDLYSKAVEVALEFHSNQVDKVGYNYLIHLATVSSNCQTRTGKIVGWLHDMIEDAGDDESKEVARNHIEHWFGEEILEIVNLLTKEDNTSYIDYIHNISSNPIAIEVKIQDLKHNLDCFRLGANDFENKNKQKYQLALFHLQEIW